MSLLKRKQINRSGSIKANIGHIDAGSGIASVVKAILILERGMILPNALFNDINPEIEAKFYNLKVPTVSTPWPSAGLRRVSITSFGFGGSNAHIILDNGRHFLEDPHLVGCHRTRKYPSNTVNDYRHGLNGKPSNGTELTKILIFSGRVESVLKRLIGLYDDCYHSTIHGDPKKLRELAYTLATRRTQFHWRSFFVVNLVSPEDQWKMDDVLKNSARTDPSRPVLGRIKWRLMRKHGDSVSVISFWL